LRKLELKEIGAKRKQKEFEIVTVDTRFFKVSS